MSGLSCRDAKDEFNEDRQCQPRDNVKIKALTVAGLTSQALAGSNRRLAGVTVDSE